MNLDIYADRIAQLNQNANGIWFPVFVTGTKESLIKNFLDLERKIDEILKRHLLEFRKDGWSAERRIGEIEDLLKSIGVEIDQLEITVPEFNDSPDALSKISYKRMKLSLFLKMFDFID